MSKPKKETNKIKNKIKRECERQTIVSPLGGDLQFKPLGPEKGTTVKYFVIFFFQFLKFSILIYYL